MGGRRTFWRRWRGEPAADAAGEPGVADLPADWRQVLERRASWWRELDGDERDWLAGFVLGFVERQRWEAARGFAVTDEMRVLVAAHAGLLLLGLADDLDDPVGVYRRVSSIILHRSTVVLDGQQSTSTTGVVAEGRTALSGQAHVRGPVLLSWGAVNSDLRHPRRGRNVVLHEFAHQIDMFDGAADGAPPLGSDEDREVWDGVRARTLRAVRAGRTSPILDDYAATDEVELFAVASELLFTRPIEMRDELPELYEALTALYRQDPAARAERAQPSPASSAEGAGRVRHVRPAGGTWHSGRRGEADGGEERVVQP